MIKKILFFIGATILVVVVAFFVKNNYGKVFESTRTEIGAKPEEEKFVPPVYVGSESSDSIIRPLYLQGTFSRDRVVLSAEQQEAISDFKAKILSRVSSSLPFNAGEKAVISISISTTSKPAIGNMIVADQAVFLFSDEELGLISEALKK